MCYLRNAIKAIIIEDGRILLIKNVDGHGTYYILPGGGQKAGENSHEALQRECKEELGKGAELEIGDLILVREYVSSHHEFAEEGEEVHQIELMFKAKLLPRSDLEGPLEPDSRQVGLEWVPLSSLVELRIYPKILAEIPPRLDEYNGPVYLGDIN